MRAPFRVYRPPACLVRLALRPSIRHWTFEAHDRRDEVRAEAGGLEKRRELIEIHV